METKIIGEKENKLIGRKEIKFELNYEQAPPKRADMVKEVAEKTNVDPSLIIIRRMRNVFGFRKLIGTAHVYSKKGTLEKYEPKHLIKRLSEEAAKEAGTKEKPKEEKPAEKKPEAAKEKEKEERKESE